MSNLMPQPAYSSIPTVKLLINGEFVESRSTEWRDVVNPATQQVLARVPFATDEEINLAVAAAKAAFKTWRKTPIGTRARVFLKYQQLIRENMKELAALLTAEQGKTLPDALGSVQRGGTIRNFMRRLRIIASKGALNDAAAKKLGYPTLSSNQLAAPAGATAVMLRSLVTWKFGDGVPPKLTPVAPLKPVPAMVTVLPPAVGPASGLIEVITGGRV